MIAMTDKETGWFRTEGGSILLMDLPLPEPIAQRVDRGEIVRVANAKGDPWTDPKPKRTKPAADPAEELKAAQAKIAELEAALVEANARLEAQTPAEPVKAQK